MANFLTEKLGPFPGWVYVIGGALILFAIAKLMQSRSKAAADAAAQPVSLEPVMPVVNNQQPPQGTIIVVGEPPSGTAPPNPPGPEPIPAPAPAPVPPPTPAPAGIPTDGQFVLRFGNLDKPGRLAFEALYGLHWWGHVGLPMGMTEQEAWDAGLLPKGRHPELSIYTFYSPPATFPEGLKKFYAGPYGGGSTGGTGVIASPNPVQA